MAEKPTSEEKYAFAEKTVKPIVAVPSKSGDGFDVLARLPSGLYLSGTNMGEHMLDMTSHEHAVLLKKGLFIDLKQVTHVEELPADHWAADTHSVVVAQSGKQKGKIIVPVTLKQIHDHLLTKSQLPVREFETDEGRKAISPVLPPEGRGAVVNLDQLKR